MNEIEKKSVAVTGYVDTPREFIERGRARVWRDLVDTHTVHTWSACTELGAYSRDD